MYYQNYEDYMKSVLGNSYSNEYINQNYNPYVSGNQSMQVNTNAIQNTNIRPKNDMENKPNISTYNKDMQNIERIKKMYPDIYFLLMPMVNKIVEENKNKEITKNLIESMTCEIYNNIEDDMMIRKTTMKETSKMSTNIPSARNNMNNPSLTNFQSSTNINSRPSLQNNNIQVTNPNAREINNKNINQNSKNIGNTVLKDLIKVLIINKIIENVDKKTNQKVAYTTNANPYIPNQIPVQNVGYYPNNTFMQQMQMNEKLNQVNPMMNRYNQIPQGNIMGNMPNMNYPFTNYFSTPYPEDEWAN